MDGSQYLTQAIYTKAKRALGRARARFLGHVARQNLRSTFTDIYDRNAWGGVRSASGTGSDVEQTTVIRGALAELIRRLNIRSILDAPCGDFYWMKECNLEVERYFGIDIVPQIVAKNREHYGREGVVFICGDITRERLPQVDLIFCRDCLVHLSFGRAKAAISNFVRSKSKYLLTTTFPGANPNQNIISGSWRPLDLQLPPFSFPEPLILINESCSEGNGRYSNKSLGLWSLEQINRKWIRRIESWITMKVA